MWYQPNIDMPLLKTDAHDVGALRSVLGTRAQQHPPYVAHCLLQLALSADLLHVDSTAASSMCG